MRGGARAALLRLLGLAGLLASLASVTGCSKRPEIVASRGPLLSIWEHEGPAARPPPAPASVSLALGSLPPDELPRIREDLRDSADFALRHAAPDLLDLGENAPEGATSGSARAALRDLPALTAAANVLGSPWGAQGISARLGASCDPTAVVCVPIFAREAGPEVALIRRGRALAWALGHAAILRVAAASRQAFEHALQEGRSNPRGTVAMVFHASRGTLDEAELEALRRQARGSLEQLPASSLQRPWLQALAAAPSTWELPFALEPDQVLVVPRLSVLARLGDFEAEVERAGTFEWIVRPR
jgi:hypothetical protein